MQSVKIILGAAFIAALVACSSSTETKPSPAAPTSTPTPTSTAEAPTTPDGCGRIVEVVNHDIGGSGKYEFEPSELKFELGECVTLKLSAETEFHTFTVDDLDIDEGLEEGKTLTLDFTFDKAGTFNLICLSHPGMTGTIVVE